MWILRRPTRELAEELAALHHRGWVETYGPLVGSGFWDRFTESGFRENWERMLQNPEVAGATTVALTTDPHPAVSPAVIGFSAARPARADHPGGAPVRPMELRVLYVDSGWHGSGVADGLLDAALPDRAQAQLWVADPNPRAQAFYARNGFAPDGAVDDGDDLEGIRQIRMVR